MKITDCLLYIILRKGNANKNDFIVKEKIYTIAHIILVSQ